MNLVKKSNASFTGCAFDLRWNKKNSSKADQYAQVAFIEIDYMECKDCVIDENCVTEFSVHSGWIVDAIRNDHNILWLTSLRFANKRKILQITGKIYLTFIPSDYEAEAYNS